MATEARSSVTGQSFRVPKTAELVAAHLRNQIVRGQLVEGDSLPPEAELMADFGVSRPTLREAFRVLESESLITIRRGARGGAKVHGISPTTAARYAGLLLQARGTTLADVYQCRIILEPAAARLLAERPTELAHSADWQWLDFDRSLWHREGTRSILHPGPLTQGASVGNEVVAWK